MAFRGHRCKSRGGDGHARAHLDRARLLGHQCQRCPEIRVDHCVSVISFTVEACDIRVGLRAVVSMYLEQLLWPFSKYLTKLRRFIHHLPP